MAACPRCPCLHQHSSVLGPHRPPELPAPHQQGNSVFQCHGNSAERPHPNPPTPLGRVRPLAARHCSPPARPPAGLAAHLREGRPLSWVGVQARLRDGRIRGRRVWREARERLVAHKSSVRLVPEGRLTRVDLPSAGRQAGGRSRGRSVIASSLPAGAGRPATSGPEAGVPTTRVLPRPLPPWRHALTAGPQSCTRRRPWSACPTPRRPGRCRTAYPSWRR
jgi:hypothetical protein